MHFGRFAPAVLVATVCSATLIAQVSPAPCYENNLGTNLGLTDDSVSQANALGFTFTGPGGVMVSTIDISSNGFIYLGSSFSSGCCNGTINGMINGLPRIAPIWTDLNPSAGGGVFFNTFPATGSIPARAVVTWDQVPEFGTNNIVTVQCQILADGSVVFSYDPTMVISNHTTAIGITEGNLNGGPATANPIDFSALAGGPPHNSVANPTVQEEFPANTLDVSGLSFEFIPNGQGGYLVFERPACRRATFSTFGHGCPQEPTVYEFFDPAANPLDLSNQSFLFTPNGQGGWAVLPGSGFNLNVTNNLGLTDDSISPPQALPFTWSYLGGAGSTTSVEVSSNGLVYLQPGTITSSRCCNGNVSTFLSGPENIAVMWTDLNPSAAGAVYADPDPSGQFFQVTWLGVPEFGSGGGMVDAQCTLFANGSFQLSYQAVSVVSHDTLVGYTGGNVSVDPGSRDLTASVPFSTGASGTPLALDSAGRPILGSTFTLDVTNIPMGTPIGFMVYGFLRLPTPLDLTALGLQGCTQFISPDITLSFPVTGSTAQQSINIPASTSFIGTVLYSQAATVSPGFTTTGIILSNAGQITLGT